MSLLIPKYRERERELIIHRMTRAEMEVLGIGYWVLIYELPKTCYIVVCTDV